RSLIVPNSAVLSTYAFRPHRARPSSPTRRSSDLGVADAPAHLRLAALVDPGHDHLGVVVEHDDRGVRPAAAVLRRPRHLRIAPRDRKSTRLNSSHVKISYAVFCLKKKKNENNNTR